MVLPELTMCPGWLCSLFLATSVQVDLFGRLPAAAEVSPNLTLEPSLDFIYFGWAGVEPGASSMLSTCSAPELRQPRCEVTEAGDPAWPCTLHPGGLQAELGRTKG